MSKVQTIEAELEKLSPKEMRAVRDWLNDCLTAQAEFDESQFLTLRKDVAAGVKEIEAGKVSPFDDGAVTRIKTRGRKLLTSKR